MAIATTTSETAAGDLKLSQIFVYPIKSCGAYTIKSKWSIVKTGLKYDRQWMVVTAEGVVLNQKRVPKMCLIKPRIDLNDGVLLLQYAGTDRKGSFSILRQVYIGMRTRTRHAERMRTFMWVNL